MSNIDLLIYFTKIPIFTKKSTTPSATIACPVSFGWIPSGKLSSGIPATHERINGIIRLFVSPATRGYTSANLDL